MTEETKVQFRKNVKWAAEMVGRAERKVSDFFKPASGNCNSVSNDSSSYTNSGKRHSYEFSKKQGQVTNSTSKTEKGDYLGDLIVEEQQVAVSPGEAYARGKSAGMSGHVPDYINTWPEELQGQFYLGMGEGQANRWVALGFLAATGIVEETLFNIASLGIRSIGFFKKAENFIESSIEIIERVSKSQTEKDLDELLKFLSKKEKDAYLKNPNKGSRWLGQAIHRGTEEDLNLEFPKRFDYHTKGPDFYDNLTEEWVELTTRGCLREHQRRYPDVPIVIYDASRFRGFANGK